VVIGGGHVQAIAEPKETRARNQIPTSKRRSRITGREWPTCHPVQAPSLVPAVDKSDIIIINTSIIQKYIYVLKLYLQGLGRS
jgi:hypothetical protein